MIELKPYIKAIFFTSDMGSEEYFIEAKKFIKQENIIKCVKTKTSGYTTMPDQKNGKLIMKNLFFLFAWMKLFMVMKYMKMNSHGTFTQKIYL